MSDGIVEKLVGDLKRVGNWAGYYVCPYCGEELSILHLGNEIDVLTEEIIDVDTYQVYCPECEMTGPREHSEIDAINAFCKQPYAIPKLYSKDEIDNNTGTLYCWVEQRMNTDGNSFGIAFPAKLVKHPSFGELAFTNADFNITDRVTEFKIVGGEYWKDAYGVSWRCWSAYPTDACRAQVKWRL